MVLYKISLHLLTIIITERFVATKFKFLILTSHQTSCKHTEFDTFIKFLDFRSTKKVHHYGKLIPSRLFLNTELPLSKAKMNVDVQTGW